MTTYYLYVKTHKQTGLKYLGQTRRNPIEYKGSGIQWRKHCKEHGYDLSTEILLETTDFYELKEAGRYYSKLWNITESNGWANIYNEYGQGGQSTRCDSTFYVEQMNHFKNRHNSTEAQRFKILQEILQTHLKILWQTQINQS